MKTIYQNESTYLNFNLKLNEYEIDLNNYQSINIYVYQYLDVILATYNINISDLSNDVDTLPIQEILFAEGKIRILIHSDITSGLDFTIPLFCRIEINDSVESIVVDLERFNIERIA